jgi:hypothetical protein
VYVVGQTGSSDFPLASALQATFGGGTDDAFVTQLSPAGALVWSTFLGGSAYDSADGIAVALDGSVYVGGYTTSSNFPHSTSPAPFQSVFGGDHDAYVVRLIYSNTGAPPVLSTNGSLTVAEGGVATITAASLRATDTDTASDHVVFTLGSAPQRGAVRLNGADLAVNGTFTQADIDAGRLTYRHDGSETTADLFDFTVSDGTHALPAASFKVTITPVDDPPTLALNDGLTVLEGAEAAIGPGQLRAADVDTSAAQLTFLVQTAPTHGALRKAGAPLTAEGSFAQADLDAGRITYAHDGSETMSDSFVVVLGDGTTTLAPATFAATVTPVDDPPTLATNAGLSVLAGATQTIGAGLLRLTDPDDQPAQLTFTVRTAPLHGTLRRQGAALLAGGTFTQADVDAGRLAYAQDGSAASSDGFAFTAADVAGAAIPQATFQITIGSINTPPAAANDSYATASGTRLTVAAPGGLLANDRDVEGTPLVAVLVAQPTRGTLNLAPNGSFTYDAAAGVVGTDTFTYRASDGQALSGVATVTITVNAASPCQPRPNVRVTIRPVAGTLAVTIETPVGPIRELRFGPTTDALVDMVGTVGRSGSFTFTPSAVTSRVDFVVHRQPGAASALVPLVVVDACGEWRTFVGGGPQGF